MAEFEIYKDASLEFRWRFKANNEKILAESAEGYNRAVCNCVYGSGGASCLLAYVS
jgi:uncharacterized protein YegP (UPF0339 family)